MEIKEITIFAPDHMAGGPHIYTVGEGVAFIQADADGVYIRFVTGHNPAQITYSRMPYIAKFEEKGGQNG